MKNKEAAFYTCNESVYNEFAADLLKLKFRDLVKDNQKVNVALSGGTTPLPILDILRKEKLDWKQFNFFMVDERCVPLSHPDSNYTNISNCFFKHIESNNFSMIKKDNTIEKSIGVYHQQLLTEVELSENRIPRFDLIILGMGEDGHTASLFPNTSALTEEEKLVTTNYVPQQKSERITLTYPILKNAAELFVLIKGSKKINIMNELYSDTPKKYPIYEVVSSGAKMSWIIGK